MLLCLFDGIPEVVHIEEPRQGVQFGFKSKQTGTTITAQMKPRKVSDFTYLPGNPIDIPFRSGASGVVDIKQLEKSLKNRVGSGAADGLDSAEYALQLVQLPWRQVWGDAEEFQVSSVFKATLKYAALSKVFTKDLP